MDDVDLLGVRQHIRLFGPSLVIAAEHRITLRRPNDPTARIETIKIIKLVPRTCVSDFVNRVTDMECWTTCAGSNWQRLT